MTRPGRRRIGVLLAAATLWAPTGAAAHSIGGDGVATVARLDVDVGGVVGQYEIQYGETASLRLRQAMDANGDGRLDFGEQRRYLDSLATRYAGGLRLRLDGTEVPVQLKAGELLPRGDWSVLPVPSAVVFGLQAEAAALTAERTELAFADTNALEGALHRTWVVTTYELVDLAAPVPGRVTPAGAARPAVAPGDSADPEPPGGRVARPGGSAAVKGIQFQGPAAGVRGQVELRLSEQARSGLHGDAAGTNPMASPWAVPVSGATFTAAVCGAIIGFGLACALLERRRRNGGTHGGEPPRA